MEPAAALRVNNDGQRRMYRVDEKLCRITNAPPPVEMAGTKFVHATFCGKPLRRDKTVHSTERPLDKKKYAPEVAHDTFDVESGTIFGRTDRASVCEAERENTEFE
jgi:hypothetical protein